MRLVDTSAWVEWLIGSPTGERVAPALPDQNDWLTPTIVQLELAKWLSREAGEDRADQIIAFSQLCVVAPLDTETALSAADICSRFKLATADAIVYATALKYDADLLTCDAHFDGLPSVVYLPKTNAARPPRSPGA
jgi:predicted nucleic acid-binding protein